MWASQIYRFRRFKTYLVSKRMSTRIRLLEDRLSILQSGIGTWVPSIGITHVGQNFRPYSVRFHHVLRTDNGIVIWNESSEYWRIILN